MATTTNYGWDTPDDTDLVKDGAAAIRTLGSSVDTTTKNLNPQTTTGALAFRSATSNINTALPIGTAGQVLTVNSGATAPEWAAPSGSGVSFTQLSSVTTTGGSTISFTGLSSYNTIMLRWNALSSTNDSRFLVGVNSDTTNANTWSIEARQNGTSAYGETYGGRINLTGYALATAGSNSSGMLLINNCKQSTFKFFNFYGVTTGPNQITGGGYYNIGAVSTLEFVASAGTIDANSGVTIWGSTI